MVWTGRLRQGTLSIASVVGSILAEFCGEVRKGQVWRCLVGCDAVRLCEAWVKLASHAVHLRVSSREARRAIGLDWSGPVGFGEVMPA